MFVSIDIASLRDFKPERWNLVLVLLACHTFNLHFWVLLRSITKPVFGHNTRNTLHINDIITDGNINKNESLKKGLHVLQLVEHDIEKVMQGREYEK
jgi:hypothetical protein